MSEATRAEQASAQKESGKIEIQIQLEFQQLRGKDYRFINNRMGNIRIQIPLLSDWLKLE